MARQKLGSLPRRSVDEEDVVISAFHSFWKGAQGGRFPRLNDRHDLWRILVTITERKAYAQLKHAGRHKRGAGQVRGESIFVRDDGSNVYRGIQQFGGPEPTPEFAAMMIEEFEQLLDRLEDRELRDVALMKLEGYTNDEIAVRLARTTRSVERKLQRIRIIWSDERVT